MIGTYVGLDLTKEDSVYLTSVVRRTVGDQLSDPVYEIQIDPHCTAIYSRQPIRYNATNGVYFAEIVGVEWWQGHDNQGYVVALLKSNGISDLNRRLVELGGVNSFPEYKPHLTLLRGGSSRIEESTGNQCAKQLTKLLKGCDITFSGEKVRTLDL